MNLNSVLSEKKITVRRLFKQDIDDILKCYKKYDSLLFNPVDSTFICNVLLCGEFWGAYHGGQLIACCYFFPLESDFFKAGASHDAITDFIAQPEKYMLMGYIGTNFDILSFDDKQYFEGKLNCANGLYTAFMNIVQSQTFRRGFKYIIHILPVKTARNIKCIFDAGYSLIKMRGLEKLVPHYIFAKAVFPCEDIYRTDSESEGVHAAFSDTKKVSALLESGYCCIDIDGNLPDLQAVCRKLIAD